MSSVAGGVPWLVFDHLMHMPQPLCRRADEEASHVPGSCLEATPPAFVHHIWTGGPPCTHRVRGLPAPRPPPAAPSPPPAVARPNPPPPLPARSLATSTRLVTNSTHLLLLLAGGGHLAVR